MATTTLMGWGGDHNAHVCTTFRHAAKVTGVPEHVLHTLGLTEALRILRGREDTMDGRTTHTVMNYETGETLEGTASPELVEASLTAPAGAVAAYCEGGIWYHVADCDVEHHQRHLGRDVATVYVEADRSAS